MTKTVVSLPHGTRLRAERASFSISNCHYDQVCRSRATFDSARMKFSQVDRWLARTARPCEVRR